MHHESDRLLLTPGSLSTTATVKQARWRGLSIAPSERLLGAIAEAVREMGFTS